MHFGTRFGGPLAAIIALGFSLFPASSSGNSTKASNVAIPVMLLQTVGEAENQCRIDREACLISASRCKSNYDYEDRLTQQCRANVVNRYKRCESRRIQTLPKTRSHPGANQLQRTINADRAKKEAVLKACGRRPSRAELQKACPARQGGCKSPGYCTQQYQYCSSSAYSTDRSNAEQWEAQTPAPPPPPVRQRPSSAPAPDNGLERVLRGGKKTIVRTDNRPIIRKVSIENTCKKPIPVAYAVETHSENVTKFRTWGWNMLKPGINIIDFPQQRANVQIYLRRGELARIRNDRTLQDYKHRSINLYYILEDQDFDVSYDHFNLPSNPNMRKVRFAQLTQGFKKDMHRFEIRKCNKKRKVQ
ncbi:hypothetical protein [Parasphingorhabdus litoris]|uniref:hypothetical protein n=1 Tax=Parasphingorhabdus litoris TaxID=394733 RepID=UPI001E62ECF5|nr:hypothetical protein [Parasphingorhabdus litoris]